MNDSPPSELGRFESVDWTHVDHDADREVGWNVLAFAVGLVALAAGFVHEHFGSGSLLRGVAMEPLDWLLGVSVLAVVTFVAVPLARNPGATLAYWRRFSDHPLGVAGLVYLVAFFVVGLVGPLFVTRPTEWNLVHSYQPPVGASVEVEYMLGSCVGPVIDGRCHGTWQYPIGTDHYGRDLVRYVILGARTSLQVALVSATLIVPTGVGVGLVAAYAGGRVDAVLMRAAEVLQTLPAIFVYLLFWLWNYEYRLLVMIAVFGLSSWGGLARLVRNESLQLREAQYVKAAEIAGAEEDQIMRRHLLPNISWSVLTNVTLQLPLLVLTEATLSFIRFPSTGTTLGDFTVVSWGQTIYYGIQVAGVFPGWWITAVPGALLVLTVLSFNRVGHALSDALDPRDGY